IKSAKKMLERRDPEVWDILEEVIYQHPVMLNRAPTLHRMGIQAFEPVLVEGNAIKIHPLVCKGFNADFDGDQMAVHLPLSAEAQAEARLLMLSANNILSPAHGAPLATPTQDMVLGSYYLTYGPEPEELLRLEESLREGGWDNEADVVALKERYDIRKRPHVFRSSQEAELSYEHGMVELHDLAEFRRGRDTGHVLTTVGRIIFNDRVERALAEALEEEFDPAQYLFINESLRKRDINRVIEGLVGLHGPHAVALVLDAFKDLGFQFASQAGITISKNDVVIPPTKQAILDGYEDQVNGIQEQYDDGLITHEERHEAIVEKWTAATDEVGQAMQDNLHHLNPIFMMANSGARGSFKQIRQLAGMRGLMANPKGEIIERPIKANFMEGLSVLEYFISTHGARKGLADTALRTADSGYLTRRLVDVSQDVIVRLEDCGTEDSIAMPLRIDGGQPNTDLLGRFTAGEFATKRGRTLVPEGELITPVHLDAIAEAYGDEAVDVPVRSVLKCEADAGICQRCYGMAPATGKVVAVGDAVGIIAAQSIGEPGTQLTLRTFHTGGVAGLDITQGLPRVVELFEARKPKGLAKLSEEDGKVSIERTEKALKVTVTDAAGEEHAYAFPVRTRLFVEDGQKVIAGDQLNEGSIYPHELLEFGGETIEKRRTATEVYLVQEVQRVYKSQGVDIQDKHIEIIVRQMMKKVRVDQKGDSAYLPGAFIDRHDLAKENAALKKSKSEQAQFEPVILGITKASLATDSFLSAASFQETTKVLTDAALEGKTDRLLGLKENVIIGKLIPAATGLKRYRRLEIEPTEPVRRHTPDEIGLLDEGDLAAELGLTEDGELEGFGFGDSGGSGGNGGESAAAFGDELADLPAPTPAPSDGDDS
ncbi:MAG: DNA-directed RNA polymerase subunit beta', partial [Actinomycetota bacterium]|nr:DNA-directed RNA polymerase subunit beta' [Actinomycetota bacterium]